MLLVVAGGRTQLVIEMRDAGQVELAGEMKFAKHVRQRDRV
jgi:hypothetical protein